jgi:hypothetical protein
VTGNYESLERFAGSADKEMQKMEANGVFEDVPEEEVGVWHRMGAALKNSDRRKALALGGVDIKDQTTLEAASRLLQGMGYPEIKARITHDCTAPGLNRAALCPPFRYPGLKDGLGLVKRGCWLSKGDVSRYFHSFPLARESRHLFLLVYRGRPRRSKRCVFDFGPCPYYTSGWGSGISPMGAEERNTVHAYG